MMTRREAQERANQHNARIVWLRDWQEYRVTLNEWNHIDREAKAYYTDDLEDAVLTAGAMRKEAPK